MGIFHKTTIAWPPIDELVARVEATSQRKVAEELGCTDEAVRIHLHKHLPTGYRMSFAADKIQRERAVIALKRLLDGGSYSRKQLFKDPRVQSNKRQNFQDRLLAYLLQNKLVERTATLHAANQMFKLSAPLAKSQLAIRALITDNMALTGILWPSQGMPDLPTDEEAEESAAVTGPPPPMPVLPDAIEPENASLSSVDLALRIEALLGAVDGPLTKTTIREHVRAEKQRTFRLVDELVTHGRLLSVPGGYTTPSAKPRADTAPPPAPKLDLPSDNDEPTDRQILEQMFKFMAILLESQTQILSRLERLEANTKESIDILRPLR